MDRKLINFNNTVIRRNSRNNSFIFIEKKPLACSCVYIEFIEQGKMYTRNYNKIYNQKLKLCGTKKMYKSTSNSTEIKLKREMGNVNYTIN